MISCWLATVVVLVVCAAGINRRLKHQSKLLKLTMSALQDLQDITAKLSANVERALPFIEAGRNGEGKIAEANTVLNAANASLESALPPVETEPGGGA